MNESHRYVIYVNTEDRKAFICCINSFIHNAGHTELIIGNRTRFSVVLSDEELTIVKLSFSKVKATRQDFEYDLPPVHSYKEKT